MLASLEIFYEIVYFTSYLHLIIIRCTVYKVFRIKEVIEIMKMEKVSENQIRCTLTREDLAERQLKISELAYGTEKAKLLFRDMMQQAAYEFGFEADDIPLMIEAIPLSADTIILVITKVEYPEELDTRFSKFSDPDSEDLYEDLASDGGQNMPLEGADDILGLFKKIQEERKKAAEETENGKAGDGKKPPLSAPVEITKLFVFQRMEELTRLACILKDLYKGRNDLYKNEFTHKYYLIVNKTPEEFNRVCNILSEYGSQQAYTAAAESYFGEHYRMLLSDSALQRLAEL